MLGDQSDILRRLKATLPLGWLPDETPVADAILSGCASTWAWVWSLLAYVRLQTRIASATDINLDLIANDFLGSNLPRRAEESDGAYRSRIQIFREMGTRAAVSSVIEAETGTPPVIFEPGNATDTGGYGAAGQVVGTGLGYGVAGGYGSLELPFQAFITIERPAGTTASAIQGYYPAGSGLSAFGGYGVGAIEYLAGSANSVSASDDDVLASINMVKPIATIMWVTFTNPTPTGSTPPSAPAVLDVNFILDVSALE